MRNHMSRSTIFGLAVMWLVGGGIYPFLSHAAETIDPINIVFIRAWGAALILFLAVIVLAPGSIKELKFDKSLIPIVISSLMYSPLCSMTLAWSSSRVPGAITALIYSTLPAMSIIYIAIKGQRPSQLAMSGIAVASVAVIFLIGAPQGSVQIVGILGALISTFAWFAATEIWIKYESGYTLILAIFLQVFIGALGTTLVHFFSSAPQVSREDVLNPSMLFLVIALASQYWAYLGISRRVSPALLTSFAFVNPLVAGLIGYLAFNQRLGGIQLIAGAILLVGVYLVVKSEAAA
ncbi:RhaT Permeases of the drug/metabolite transporter (DMT) superfamily [Candidatus Nanopelagicaceae bacterium]